MTEADIRLVETLVAKYGKEALAEGFFDDPAVRKAVLSGVVGGLTFCGAAHLNNYVHMQKAIKTSQEIEAWEKVHPEFADNYDDDTYEWDDVVSDSERQQKVDAVDELVRERLKLTKKDTLPFSPEKLVDACEKYDFDLPGALAQAWNETAFGTKGRALWTHSLFSIGAWDTKTVAEYDCLDDSIEPYIRRVTVDYLLKDPSDYGITPPKWRSMPKYTKNKHEKKFTDLISGPNSYVNYDNKRYATREDYEDDVRSTRNAIIYAYPVLAPK